MCGFGHHYPQITRLPADHGSVVTRSIVKRRRRCDVCTRLFTPSVASTHGIYQITLKILRYEAEIGSCASCVILWRGIMNMLKGDGGATRRDSFASEQSNECNRYIETNQPHGLQNSELDGLCVEYQSDPNFECPALIGGWRIFCRCKMKPCAHETYHMTFDVFTLADYVQNSSSGMSIPLKTCRLIEDRHTRSPGTMSFLRNCLAVCQTSHGCCNLDDQEFPTSIRLMRLSGDRVKLVDVESTSQVRYACLAHRWTTRNPWDNEGDISTAYGISRRCRTLHQNLPKHKEGLSIRSLLPTYQDAIFVTKEMGLEFIWIDSLCIIQDDAEDKDIQIANMGAIYSNAVFTIAADTDKDHTQPFLNDRPWRWRAHKQIESGTAIDNKDAIYFRERPSHANLSWTGLFTRGWCFQERLLSKRVLRFQACEVIFECNAGLECECGSSPGGHQGPWESLEPSKHVHDKAAFSRSVLNEQATSDPEAWSSLVHDYSQTRLTIEADRMNALAGIIARVTKLDMCKGRYTAGLWESSLVEDLLWYTETVSKSSTMSGSNVPSWSWMSIPLGDHRVLYSQKKDFKSLVQVKQTHCEPRSTHLPLGDVAEGAFIEVEGQMFSASVGKDSSVIFLGDLNTVDMDDTYLSWDPGRRPQIIGQERHFSLLLLACWTQESHTREAFLVLQAHKSFPLDETSKSKGFIRIGYLEMPQNMRLHTKDIETASRRLRIF